MARRLGSEARPNAPDLRSGGPQGPREFESPPQRPHISLGRKAAASPRSCRIPTWSIARRIYRAGSRSLDHGAEWPPPSRTLRRDRRGGPRPHHPRRHRHRCRARSLDPRPGDRGWDRDCNPAPWYGRRVRSQPTHRPNSLLSGGFASHSTPPGHIHRVCPSRVFSHSVATDFAGGAELAHCRILWVVLRDLSPCPGPRTAKTSEILGGSRIPPEAEVAIRKIGPSTSNPVDLRNHKLETTGFVAPQVRIASDPRVSSGWAISSYLLSHRSARLMKPSAHDGSDDFPSPIHDSHRDRSLYCRGRCRLRGKPSTNCTRIRRQHPASGDTESRAVGMSAFRRPVHRAQRHAGH